MNELIAAAKAVIEDLGFLSDASIDGLRAAVERAEKQDAVRLSDDEIFDIENNLPDEYIGDIKYTLGFARAIEQAAWAAAQQAERERIKAIILGMDKTLGITWAPEWTQCVNVIMEKINE